MNVSKSNCGGVGAILILKKPYMVFQRNNFLVMFHQEDLQIVSYQSLVQQASFDLNAVVSRGSEHKRNCPRSSYKWSYNPYKWP